MPTGSQPTTAPAQPMGASPSPEVIPPVSAKLAEDEIQAAIEVLRSGNLRQGPRCAEFEEKFAALSESKFAKTTSNGTTALQLAYECLIQPGDEVLCNAFGFIATASMIVARGAIPVFCDVDPDTFNIDPADAANRTTSKTTAIAPTHLYGNPVRIDAITELAAANNLKVIYDAAQAHLATYDGRGLGAFGDAVTYSFYPTKNMTTGEGGMVTTNDADLDAALAMKRDHGAQPGVRYCHVDLGYNYRLTDVAAAIGIKQLEKLSDRTAARRANAQALNEQLGDVGQIQTPGTTPKAEHAWHQYTIRLNLDQLTIDRDEFANRLLAAGVATAIHYPRSIPDQPIMLDRAPRRGPTPISDALCEQVLCLPVHHALTPEQVDRIATAVRSVARSAAR